MSDKTKVSCDSCMTIDKMIVALQAFKEEYGGDAPVHLQSPTLQDLENDLIQSNSLWNPDVAKYITYGLFFIVAEPVVEAYDPEGEPEMIIFIRNWPY